MKKIYKIVVFVPELAADRVRQVMGEVGAGKIGNYSHCTYSMKGIGRFMPLEGSKPTEGEIGKIGEVVEERIETICDKEKLDAVLKAIKTAHPYEEAPIDVYEIMIK